MKSPRSWSIVGLLCLSGAIGCAQLPSRGSFVRRGELQSQQSPRDEEPQNAQLPTNDDPLAQVVDEPSVDREAISSTQFDSHVEDQTPREDVVPLIDQPPSDTIGHSTGGYFDVSHGPPLNRNLEPVEAPPPRRPSDRPPSPGSVARNVDDRGVLAFPDARSLQQNYGTEHPANRSRLENGVVTANHERQGSHTIEPQIRQIAATRTLPDDNRVVANPWNRFQGLLSDNPSADGSERAPQNPSTTSFPNQPALPPAASVAMQPAPWESSPPSLPPQPFVSQPNISTGDSLEAWPYAPANGLPIRNAAPAGAPNSLMPVESWPNSTPGFVNNETNPRFHFPPAPNLTASSNDRSLSNPHSLEGVQSGIVPLTNSPELDRLIAQTALEAAALTPGDTEFSRQLYLRKHVQLRLLYLIAGQVDRALQPVIGIAPADQEFWQQMLWGIANYFDTQGMPDSTERATQTVIQLRAAAACLQERARLELRNVTLCHRISGFGNYERFRRDEFTAGQPVLLYAEVIGFKSEPTPDGQFRTVMKSTIEIVEAGPTGQIVESITLSPSEDLCRNQRRDYYHSYEFAIPQSCQPGKHTLRLRVEDQLSKKLAVSTLNFLVQ